MVSTPERPKKTILSVGHTQVACENNKSRILTFLGDYVDVVTWHVSDSAEPPPAINTVDLVLVTTKKDYDFCLTRCPSKTPVLLADRVLSTQRLDELIALDESTKAYVVGSSYEPTAHTINLLYELGFDHLVLIPCYPGMPESLQTDITVGISPGIPHLVPPHITNVIDVGPKEVAISTLAEILRLLAIPFSVLNKVSNFYIHSLLTDTRKRSLMGIRNKVLNSQLQAILNTLQEAIVALDENRKIVVYNHASEKIFSVPIAKAIGADWLDITADPILIECMENGEGFSRMLFMDGQHYLVMAEVIRGHAGKVQGAVATFHPVEEIKELESKVRRELSERANVARRTFKDIRGSSLELQKAVSLASKFAATDLTVLLEGESGTGKELFAQAIHNSSARRGNPFVAINFAAIPDSLVESELFGYEEGAFTGARKGGRRGLFEEAHLGTIFLDEIGSITSDVQNRLLRVLEEREIRRLGSGKNLSVDVRVIAATNINLEKLVAKNVFRDDLYYRLCVLPISIPPLRNRKEDIARLARHFAKSYSAALEFSTGILDTFVHYAWPGNIRELQNVIKYLCSVVDPGRTAETDDLPPYLLSKLAGVQRADPEEKAPPAAPATAAPLPVFGKIQTPGTRQAIIALLSAMYEKSVESKGIGYFRLLEIVKDSLPGVSAYYIKKWLKDLKEMGYVDTGRTRQGSSITEKGAVLLKTLRETEE